MMFKHANMREASCVDRYAALWVDGAVSKYDLTTAESSSISFGRPSSQPDGSLRGMCASARLLAPRHSRRDDGQDQTSADPERIAQAVADDEAELAIQVTSLLLVRGVELVGKIPPSYRTTLCSRSVLAPLPASRKPPRPFIKHPVSPEAVPAIEAKGWEPATR